MASLEEIRSRIDAARGAAPPIAVRGRAGPQREPVTLEDIKARIAEAKEAPPIPELQGFPEEPQPQAFGSLRRGMARTAQARAILGRELGLLTPEETARQMGSAQIEIEKAPPSEAVEQGLREIGEAKGFGEALSAIVRNPSAVVSVIGESLPLSALPLAGGAAGSVAGPAGTGVGVGAGSAAVEYASSLLESLQTEGIDPLDDVSVAAALQDPAFMAKARDRAAKRGIAVGAFDALTGGLAGRFLAGASGLASTVRRGAGELALQAGGGAGGEAAAQLATEGRITAPGEVLLEAAAEVLPGVGETALNVPGLRARHGPTRPPGAGRQAPIGPAAGAAIDAAGIPSGPQGPTIPQTVGPSTEARPPPELSREFLAHRIRALQGRQSPGTPAERGPTFPGRTPSTPEIAPGGAPGVTQAPSEGPGTVRPDIGPVITAAQPPDRPVLADVMGPPKPLDIEGRLHRKTPPRSLETLESLLDQADKLRGAPTATPEIKREAEFLQQDTLNRLEDVRQQVAAVPEEKRAGLPPIDFRLRTARGRETTFRLKPDLEGLDRLVSKLQTRTAVSKFYSQTPGASVRESGQARGAGAAPTIDDLRARIGQARGLAPPGDKYVGFRPETVEGATPETPIRREDVLRPLMTALGVPLYQGRMKGRKLLGFYRPKLEEVRIKRMSDIEVAAHEIAHLLDDRIPEIRKQWLPATNANQGIRGELRGVSYDRSKLFEGFAEFVRLWATQTEKAKEAAPNFFGWFEDFVARSEYGPALRKAQADMHAWFEQDALSRARSKIGLAEDINAGLTGFWDRFRQGVADDLHGIMRMEEDLTGQISPAGPYETARLTRARYSIIEGALLYGAPVVNPDGSHSYQGKGLKQILDPVAERLDDWLTYAVGRSAAELREQGRENLFTAAEVKAMSSIHGVGFNKAFQEYQEWNQAVLDFAEAKGVINPVARASWKRTQYLPFHRVGQPGAFSPVPGDWRGIRALTGGTDNLRDILSNIIGNASMLMDAAITNEARLQVAKLARQRGGAKFMARIPTEERTVKVSRFEIERAILEALGVARKSELDPGRRLLVEQIVANLGGMVPLIQRGQTPFGGNVVAVLEQGKPAYYEVADPLLYSALTHLNRPARHGLIRLLGAFKRLGQASITLSIDFLAANIARDTLMGGVMSRTGFKPFIDSVRGLKSRLVSDQNYQEYIANGGGFSSYFVDETAFRKHLERFYTKKGIDYRTVLDSPANLLYAIERIADSFEMATRLGEFRRAQAQGQHPRHSAYLSREVSTDFAMRGDWAPIGYAYDTIIFLKAAVNGIDRLYRGLVKDPNRIAVAGKIATLAMLSAGLAALNRGIPDYDDMEDWDRDSHWHFYIPTPETLQAWADGRPLPPIEQRYEHFRYPKIWEIGAVASLAERTLQRLLDDEANELPEDFGRILEDTFRVEYLPQAIAPLAEAGIPFTENRGMNRLRFFDRPIQSEKLLEMQPWARSSPYTSHTLRRLGEASRNLPRGMQPVPVQVEALLRGYFNTWALYGLTVSDGLLFDDSPSLRVDQYPGIRRFYRETPAARTRFMTEFYSMVKEATEARRTMREMARTSRPEIAEELAYSRANLEYRQLTGAQNVIRNLGGATNRVLSARNLASLREMASQLARHKQFRVPLLKIARSKSWADLGDLKRDLRDMLVAEQNKLAKRLVRTMKVRKKEAR